MRSITRSPISRYLLALAVLGVAACNHEAQPSKASKTSTESGESASSSAAEATKAKGAVSIKSLIRNADLGVTGYVSGDLTPKSSIAPETIVRNYATQNGATLDVGSDVSVVKSFVNDRGETIVKVEQTLDGVPVEGTLQSYTVAADGVLKVISGVNLPKLRLDAGSVFLLTAEDAIEIAKSELKRQGRPTDEFSASPTIIRASDGRVHCAFKVLVGLTEPAVEAWEVTVDATEGHVLSTREALYHEAVTMTGTGPYGDKRILHGWKGAVAQLGIIPALPYALVDLSRPPPAGRVRDDGTPLSVQTYEHTPASAYSATANRAIASDDNGTILAGYVTETKDNYHAVDTHFYMGKFAEFLTERYRRFSFDDQGAHFVATCHSLFPTSTGGLSPNNAAFSPATKQIYIGDGDGTQFGPFATAETIGHEFTHALIDSETYLPYVYETGAINEGLADFFGEVFGVYADGTAPDWKKMGKEYTPNVSGDAYLDYKNPQSNGFPDHLENRYKGTKDRTGVHLNAAILTKAFSLMSDGGVFHTVTVPAIGMEKLSQILYNVIVERLTPQTNFEQFAVATIEMSAVLYGNDSVEHASTKAGFQAVGIQNNVEQWDYLTDSPFATGEEFSGVALGDKIYIVGGSRGLEPSSKETWEYGITTNEWTRKSDMLTTRLNARTVALHDKLYVLNGFVDDTYNVPGTTVEEYDPATDHWQTIGELPFTLGATQKLLAAEEATAYDLASQDTWVRIHSGTLPNGATLRVTMQSSDDTFATVETVSTATLTQSNHDLWIQRVSPAAHRVVVTAVGQSAEVSIAATQFRAFGSAVAHEDSIYVVGGTLGVPYLNSPGMDAFNVVTRTWIRGLPGPAKPRHSGSAVVANVGGVPKLMLFFGFHNGDYLREIDSYDFASGQWSTAGLVPEDVKLLDASPVVYRNQLHFVGGSTTTATDIGLLVAPAGGATLVYDVNSGNWYTNQLLGMPANMGVPAVSRDTLFYVSTPDPFASIYDLPKLRVTAFDPLRINIIESEPAATLHWTKFDGTTQSRLVVNGTQRYAGTGTDYVDGDWFGVPRKRVSQAGQVHPLYGSITSKGLCTTWAMVGDVNEDGTINASDVSLLGAATEGGKVLPRLAQVAADMDGNNVVDNQDLGILSTYVATGANPPRIGEKSLIVFGDLTNDGKVDYRDARRLEQGILGSEPLSLAQAAAADVDGNQRLNSTDVSYIKRYTLNRDVVFPAAK